MENQFTHTTLEKWGEQDGARKAPATVKFITGFVVSAYLMGALGFGGNHYFGHPEQGLIDAVALGLDWPGVFVEVGSSPQL